MQVDCELGPDDRSGYALRCGTATGLQAVFEVELRQDTLQVVRVVQLRAPHDTNLLQPDIIRLAQVAGGIDIEPGYKSSKLSLRLDNGNRIKSLQLRWDGDQPSSQATLTLEIAPEFELIEQALLKMQQSTTASLGEDKFQRHAVIRELTEVLGLQPLVWADQPRPVAIQSKPEQPVLEGNLSLLVPYCGYCHADDTVNPPGFLFGDQAQARITHCAPHILQRLQAWHKSSDFTGSPMPPPASLAISGTTADEWPRSHHYRSLVSSIEQLVSTGRTDHDFPNLPACLPLTGE